MLEEVMFTLLGLLVAFNVGHLLTLRRCESALLALSIESRRLTDYDPTSALDEMKDEVQNLVLEVVSSMKTPTIADHLGGVVAQFAQMRMMKMLHAEGMLPDGSPLATDEAATLD
jgi:hypothetical protein